MQGKLLDAFCPVPSKPPFKTKALTSPSTKSIWQLTSFPRNCPQLKRTTKPKPMHVDNKFLLPLVLTWETLRASHFPGTGQGSAELYHGFPSADSCFLPWVPSLASLELSPTSFLFFHPYLQSLLTRELYFLQHRFSLGLKNS